MAERLGNLGYVALGKETTKGTAVVPSIFLQAYTESLTTNMNIQALNPVAGNKFAAYSTIPGQRDHKGSFEILCEPNTVAYIADMLLTRGNVSGSGPYTWPFTLSSTTNPNSYTVDISDGERVHRFTGVEASKITPKFDKNELRLNVAVSALGSIMSRQIASVSGSGPYTVVLDTTYDPSPTTGLVVGDLISFYHSGSAVTTATVATITNGTTLTTTTNVSSFVAGDTVYLRPQTTTFNLLTPFQWAKTQFIPGATAAAALSGTQTRVETGSEWSLEHKFESDNGAARSGAYDPAALVRTQGDATLKVKKYYDTADDLQTWEQQNKQAWVIRMYSGLTNQYELRVTFNNTKIKAGVKPNLDSGKILYSEEEFIPVYDSSDAQAIALTVVNNLSAL